MKVLLLSPAVYTLPKTIEKGVSQIGHSVLQYDFRVDIPNWQKQFNTQSFRLPYKVRHIWENFYLPEINKHHIKIYDQFDPDIVFIYNNEMLLPETLRYFKNKSRIIFFMGDNPYYTPTNDHYMALLFLADLIVSPDSFWAEQLKLLGLKNIILDFPGYDGQQYENINPGPEEKEKYNRDILFIGTGYPNAWGYKRALFLNHFTPFDIKVYGGRHFIKWFKYFPELEKKFALKKGHIPLEELVKMHKCAKIYPVDANPAILNGIHLRIFDCIAMGVLPLVEYRKDLGTFFKEVELPVIKNYKNIKGVTTKFLKDENLRINTLKKLKDYCKVNYSAEVVMKRIINAL